MNERQERNIMQGIFFLIKKNKKMKWNEKETLKIEPIKPTKVSILSRLQLSLFYKKIIFFLCFEYHEYTII